MTWNTTAITVLRQEVQPLHVHTQAHGDLSAVHVQAVWKDGFQTDALPVPYDPHGLDHVLPGQKFVPQYRLDPAFRDEYPGVPHDHQQLVYPLCPHVSEHRLTAHSHAGLQLRRVTRR